MRLWEVCRHVALAMALSAYIVPLTVFARPPAGEAKNESPKEKARGLAQDGIKAFQAGDNQRAIELLGQAEALFHAPVHPLYMARANLALGKLVEAKALFRKVATEELGASAPPPWVSAREAAVKELADIDKRVPRIVVTVLPDAKDVTVTMNDLPLPGELGAPLEVDAGTYLFKASAYGKTTSQSIEAKESTTVEVKLVVSKPGALPPPPPPVSKGPSGVRVLSVIAMGVGGAGMIAGATLGGLGLSKRGQANKAFTACDAKFGHNQCQGSDADAVKKTDKTATLMENAGLGVLVGGAAILGTGIVLFATSGKHGEGSPPARTGSVSWLPVVGPGFVGIDGRF